MNEKEESKKCFEDVIVRNVPRDSEEYQDAFFWYVINWYSVKRDP